MLSRHTLYHDRRYADRAKRRAIDSLQRQGVQRRTRTRCL